MEQGLIHLYYGDGKGKTTAAVGLCVRAAGGGERVLFVQFMKDGASGEVGVFKNLPKVRTLHAKAPKGFYSRMSEEEKALFAKEQEKLFQRTLKEVDRMKEEGGGLVVLDEITYAYAWNLIDREKLERLLVYKPENIELVLTGRNPDRVLLNAADYITEMKCEKHPFEKGIAARKGIEF